MVDRVHHEYPPTTGTNCHCPEPKECIGPRPSRELFPKKFDTVPSLRPANSTVEAAKDIDWEAALLTPNGGFLMVEEWDHCSSGMPDLVVWRMEDKVVRFVEVKGPGDRLSETQKVWIDVLLRAGIEVQVGIVREG